MAKRRKLEAPSAEDLGRIEEQFRRETPARSLTAPIAQVAAETAAALEPGSADDRAAQARDEADAKTYRRADADGLVLREIPLGQIDPASLPRDRTVVDQASMAELEHSIETHGQRLPIEVYLLPGAGPEKPYGLLSGYRRLLAQQNVLARSGADKFARIKSIIRDPDQMGGAFVAMVEENEIRQNLSHFERGRIAVIAAQQGAFRNAEDAVNDMFAAASKAKRSKIRSFAMIFEELGDVLTHPETLREKDGLHLAQALRTGAGPRLREALGAGQVTDAASEWALIDAVLQELEPRTATKPKGGRPRASAGGVNWGDDKTVTTAKGVQLRIDREGDGYALRLKGVELTDEKIVALLADVERRLERG